MTAGSAFREHRGIRRFQRHDLHFRLLFLQVFPHAGESPAGADAGDEDIHFSVGIFPDFRTGGGFMDGRVSRVDELTRDKASRGLGRQLFCLGDGALHALGSFCQHDLGAVGFQDVPSFHAHGFRHGEDDPVAFGCGDGRQADAGVAGGGFNDDSAFL